MNLFLDSLFRVATEVTLPGGEVVRVRALSEYELSARERYAQAEAARFVKRVSDENSEEYAALILPLLQSDEQSREIALRIYLRSDAKRMARERHAPKYIPIPDGATEEEERRVLIQREEEIARVEEKRREDTEKIYAELEKDLEKMDGNKILSALREKTIEYAASSIKTRELVAYTIYAATERPGGGKRFSSPAEARELPESVRDIIIAAFAEVNNKDPLSLSGQSLTG